MKHYGSRCIADVLLLETKQGDIVIWETVNIIT